MRLSENRVLAWIVLVLCVVFSAVVLGGNSLARQREAVVDVFYEGAEDRDADHCMNVYLNRAFENARTMALEVQLHLGEDHETAAEILELVNSYEPENDPGFFESGSRYKELKQYADDLYNNMYAANLADEQRRDFKLAYDDFKGAGKMMEKDPYCDLAEEFNEARSANFLSEGISMLRSIDRLCEIQA